MNSFLIVVLLSAAAPFTDDELKDLAESPNAEPSNMADRATFKSGPLPWCDGPFPGETTWEHNRMRRAIGTRVPQVEAFIQLCELPDEPSYWKAAGYAIQKVMHENGDKKPGPAIERVKKWIVAWKREKSGVPASDEEKFAFSENSLPAGKPAPLTEEVKDGPIEWCDGIDVDDDRWDTNRINRSFEERYGIKGVVQAAAHLCWRKDDATWKQAGAGVLQKWLNWTGQSKADGVKSLNARGRPGFEEQQRALCKALELDPEASGADAVFGKAQLAFFGCSNELAPLWQDRKAVDDLRFYLDPLDAVPGEVVRLAYLFSAVPDEGELPETFPSKDASENTPLLRFAMVQRDFAQLNDAALKKELAGTPYNDAARVIANENLAKIRRVQRVYAAAIEQMTKKDDDLKEILIKAPAKGYAEWDKTAAKWKAEFKRSNDFEAKLSQPSRKVLKGCLKELRPDVQKAVKAMKASDYKELVGKLSTDTAAGLLLSRLAVCAAYENVKGFSGPLEELVRRGRDIRGPRTAAYYAIIDALAEAKKDRPKLALQLENFQLWDSQSLPTRYNGEFNFSGRLLWEFESTRTAGVVASTKKVPEGVQITFKRSQYTIPEQHCVDTNRPLRIEASGIITYQQSCKYTGRMQTIDNTPEPVVVAEEVATGVKTGVYVSCQSYGDRAKNNTFLGTADFTKKSANDKKILTFYGFSL